MNYHNSRGKNKAHAPGLASLNRVGLQQHRGTLNPTPLQTFRLP